jgi:hypothetical protein
MKRMKIGVVLLAFLLAAMAMVPMVNAVDVTPISPIHKVALASGDNQNIFDAMGLEKSQITQNPVPLMTYNESKGIADKIMKKAAIADSEKSVIGIYDFGSSQILLISREGNVLEVVDDGKSVTTRMIVPKLVGERERTYAQRNGVTDRLTNEDGQFITSITDKMYSFSVQQPNSARALTTYAIQRSRTDSYVGTQTWITGTAKGTFYINPGVSITSILDESSYNVVFPYQYCEWRHSPSGVGSQVGQVNNHVKGGSLYFRCQIDNWVSMDASGKEGDGGSAVKWMGSTPDGCA